MKLKIKTPVIVEGKYDKIKLSSLLDAQIITTDGVGIFKDKNKKEYIKALCKNGVIIATDSDSAGNLIRGHLKGVLPNDKIHNVYIPQIKGKERRKKAPSKEGYLGVEGMEREVIEKALAPYDDGGDGAPKMTLTKADFYALGLSGKDNSAERRRALARRLGLPQNISASALIEAINLTATKDEFAAAIKEIGE